MMHLPLSPRFLIGFLLAICIPSVQCSHRKDERMKDVKKLDEIDKLKSFKNGSIVLYFESFDRPTKRVEQTLLKANNELKRYGFKLRKLDCKKFSKLKECRSVDEPIVYMFKTGEWRTYEENELNGLDLAINQILFFMANAHHDKMMDCSDMLQVKQFVEINTNYLNTVVGSFQRKDSEYLRRFLEVIMDLGRVVAFLLVSGKEVDKSLYNDRGFFIRFYYSLKPKAGEEPQFIDISDKAHTKTDLKSIVTVLNLADEFKMHRSALEEAEQAQRDAPKKKEEMIAGIKEKALEDLHKKMKNQNKGNSPKRSTPVKQTKTRREPGLALHVKEGLSEISLDAYNDFWERNFIPKDKSDYHLNEAELRDAISKNNGIKNGVLIVLFYVPWETTFQMFESHYHYLGDKYKDDSSVSIAQLDCWAWLTICAEHQIHAYPTILVFRNGMEPFAYTGLLEVENIAKHVTFWKDPLLPQVTHIRQLEQITKQMKKIFLMGVFGNDSTVIDVRQKEFEKVALEYYGKLRIGIAVVRDKEIVYNKQKHILPIVIAGNANGDRGRITTTNEFDKEKLIAWIHDQKREKVEQLTYKNFPSLVTIGKPFLISFQEKDKDLSPLHKFANRFPDLITVWMDKDCPLNEYIMDIYKMKKNGSKIVILDKVNNKVFEYTGEKKTIGKVAEWVKKCMTYTDTYATHSLSNFREVINEGYDFLKLEDELEKLEKATSNNNKEKEADGGPVSADKLDKQRAAYNEAMGIKTVDVAENPEIVYQNYKSLKYRPEMRGHDEL